MLVWEHSSCSGEECSPHISEHCVQQMSRFLLLLQVLVSPLETGGEAMPGWAVRVISRVNPRGLKMLLCDFIVIEWRGVEIGLVLVLFFHSSVY